MAMQQVFYHSTNRFGLNLSNVGKEDCSPDHSFGPFKRHHFLVHIVFKGKGRYQVGNQKFILGGGDCFLIRPDELTTYTADHDEPWSYCWLAFDGYDSEMVLKAIGFTKLNYVINIQKIDEAISIIDKLISEGELTGSFRCMSLLYDLFSLMACGRPEDENQRKGYVKNAVEFIKSNYAYPITVENVARAIGLERSYLYRQFMEDLGMSPKSYLTWYRLMISRELLMQEEMSVTEVAFSCGFTSISSFYFAFSRQFGMTPKEYVLKGKLIDKKYS